MNGHDPDHDMPRPPAGLTNSRELFERSVERIDAATGNRLRLMRRDALAGARQRRARWLAPGVTAALVLLLAGLAWWLPAPPEQAAAALPPEILDGGEAVFPGDKDAEMYAWLGEAPVAVDPLDEEAL